MAYLIPKFTHPRTGATSDNAYARIQSVQVSKELSVAKVQLDIYASKELFTAKKDPIAQQVVMFSKLASGIDLFTPNFLRTPAIPADLPAPATTVSDILLSNAYLGLKNHPQTSALLGAATAA